MNGNQRTVLVFAAFVLLSVGGALTGAWIGGDAGTAIGAASGFGLSIAFVYAVNGLLAFPNKKNEDPS